VDAAKKAAESAKDILERAEREHRDSELDDQKRRAVEDVTKAITIISTRVNSNIIPLLEEVERLKDEFDKSLNNQQELRKKVSRIPEIARPLTDEDKQNVKQLEEIKIRNTADLKSLVDLNKSAVKVLKLLETEVSNIYDRSPGWIRQPILKFLRTTQKTQRDIEDVDDLSSRLDSELKGAKTAILSADKAIMNCRKGNVY
jgi:hypothetical protein